MQQNVSKYLGNEKKYLDMVLATENWAATSGSWNKTLEEKFAQKMECKYAVAFNSGTATLHAALLAVGVKPGDEVISPAVTVIMDTTATLHANAIPVYCDVDPRTFNLDPKDLRKKITPKTKAIIAVALYGLPADMDEIMKIADEHGIAVIEDNAQCFLSRYKGRMSGTLGHISSWSFENSKHLSCGEGGIITTNIEKYAETCRKVGGHGFKNLRAEEGRIRLNQEVFQDPDYKRHDSLGWNYRMPEFNAAVSLAQLERLDELVELRIKSAEIFLDEMSRCDYFQPQYVPEGVEHSYFTLGVVYNGEEKNGVPWRDFRREYVAQGGDGIYAAWSVPYLEPLMSERVFVSHYPQIYENVSYKQGLCPTAEALQKKLMQFKANYRDLDLAKAKALCLRKTIEKFAKK
jgi:perosamine synthetase